MIKSEIYCFNIRLDNPDYCVKFYKLLNWDIILNLKLTLLNCYMIPGLFYNFILTITANSDFKLEIVVFNLLPLVIF